MREIWPIGDNNSFCRGRVSQRKIGDAITTQAKRCIDLHKIKDERDANCNINSAKKKLLQSVHAVERFCSLNRGQKAWKLIVNGIARTGGERDFEPSVQVLARTTV